MEKSGKGEFWTIRYAMINATYFMGFCGIHAYASVFLLSRGFTNFEIGMLIALANIFSVLLQPVIAGMIDKQGKLTNRNVAAYSTVLIIAGSLGLFFIRDGKAAIYILFMLIYMIQMACQGILTALYFEYAGKGCNINFGLARGLGSAGFALYALILGILLKWYNVSVVHIANVCVLLIGLLVILTFQIPERTDVLFTENKKNKEESTGECLAAHNNFFAFALHYPKFMLFLTAAIFLFFAHYMINDYFIQIISPFGGTKQDVGYATSLAAIVELPAMAYFGKLLQKISCEKLMIFSAALFTVKTGLMLFATDMTGVYISQFCQIGAYAVFIPASAYYVNQVMEKFDRVKGQAYVNCAFTLGGMLSGLICGKILDAAGAGTMLVCGVFVSFLGVILLVAAFSKLFLRFHL